MTFSRMWKHRSGILVVILILIGSFLRLYRLPSTMQFYGDQGRDAIIAAHILIDHHPALLGPVTSVGNMYLGPFYYYFMVVPLMMSYPSPTGPAFAVAFVGILTLILIYVLGKRMVGPKAALIALALYAVSPIVIANVRFSWNPNIVPLFSLLLCWLLYRVLRDHQPRLWIWISVVFAILVQLHYITLIMGMFAGLIWLMELVSMIRSKNVSLEFIKSTAIAIVVFLVSLTPLIAFDLRHQGINYHAFLAFFKSNGQHFRFIDALSAILFQGIGLTFRTLLELFKIQPTDSLRFGGVGLIVLLCIVVLVLQRKKDSYQRGRRLILGLFFFSILVLSLYRSSIFDHYLAFVFPLASLMAGILLGWLWEHGLLRVVSLVLLVVLIVTSLQHYPGKENLGDNIEMMQRTSTAIEAKVAPGETYNILLYSNTHDYQGMNYRYFLETMPRKPESEDQFSGFTTLFIIDEQQRASVFDESQYMIATWPNRTIIDDFTISGGPRVVELKR